MKQRLTALLLTLCLALSLSGCSSSVRKSISDDSGGNAAQNQTAAETTEAAKPSVTIEENTVLVDQDGLVVTAKDLTDDPIMGWGIEVLLENSTDKNLTVQCGSLIVNNYMITDLFSADVAAGKKSNDTIWLSSTGLAAAGIDTISDIALTFLALDSDSFATLFETNEIELKTSAYGTVEQPAMDDGKELINENGVRIVGKYVDENSFWGAGVLLYIENSSGKNIVVQCDNMSINGFMVTPYFSSTVNDGRMALDTITILSSDLENNGITSVDDIELTFQIIDPDTFQTIFETGPVEFSTK